MKKKISLLVLSIILVLIILSTTTYALFFKQNKLEQEESYTAGILDIVLDNDEEGLGETLTVANSIPISDSEGKETTPYKFKITNRGNISYTFDLKILATTLENSININYIKIMIDNDDPIAYSELNNNVIKSGITLNPKKSIVISVRIWLDEYTPNTEIGKKFSAKIVSDGVASEYVPTNLDESGANSPDLVEGLTPIMYNGNAWVKANSTNTDEEYKWYDYNNKQWANAVLLSSDYRDNENNDIFEVGDEVPEEAILAYYVWIPRYKYKVWNINKEIGVDSYDAYHTGIDIVFEKELESTGTITCNPYNFNAASGSLSQICSGSNGEYYTHPAFTFGSDELRGIWVGKFEISPPVESECYTSLDFSCSSFLSVRIKPNFNIWTWGQFYNFYNSILNMMLEDNEYGLDNTTTDSHMIKNIEWGSVAYLTNSKYGRCNDGECVKLEANDYEFTSSSGEIGFVTGGNDYFGNILQSTTGNIYGIYDMSGGTTEFVSGSYNPDSWGIDESKNVDIYSGGSSYNNQIAYNRSRLGDATGEVVLSEDSIVTWYDDSAKFIYTKGDNMYDIFIRGSGIFGFGAFGGNMVPSHYSTRATLTSLQ